MNPWPFIWAAYTVTALGVLALSFFSWAAMRQAETEAAALSERP